MTAATMTKPKTLAHLMDGCPGLTVVAGSADVAVADIAVDSRRVGPQSLFIAIPGTVVDGLSFVPQAVAAGATSVVLAKGSADKLGPLPSGITVVEAENPRLAVSLLAAAFTEHRQPAHVMAVTGTNGKTSTATFARQICQILGHKAASLGTLGLTAPDTTLAGSATTPDPISLHKTLAALSDHGVTHLCMEASSHGLDQHRSDGARLRAAAFTNLTRDHLDYHHSFQAYFAAKCRLFSDLLPSGGTAVLNADAEQFDVLAEIAQARGCTVLAYGVNGADLHLISRRPMGEGQELELSILGHPYTVMLPLAGAFQAENALAALGLVLACGADRDQAVAALEKLDGVPGRLELVGTVNGASVYVDYAHTPDALETVLDALRPHVDGRLVCIFGCGGDRDAGKRPEMGAIAARLADVAIVTDDNPRSEDPAQIRQEILAACPTALEIGDRRMAINVAVQGLRPDDILVIAGKGHESGQTVGKTVTPFDDRDEGRLAIAKVQQEPLWTANVLSIATLGTVVGRDLPFGCTGVSIDSRTVNVGDLFIALQGPSFDGHDWVRSALLSGAAAAMVHKIPESIGEDDPLRDRLILVKDTFVALNDLGRAGRLRFDGRVVGVTGSVGKTSTKEMLSLALSALGQTHAAVGSFNNHWGVPLTLARMPQYADFAVIEMGMNHAGEIAVLTKLARPHVAVITTIAGAHIEHLGSMEAIADAKAEIFNSVEPIGVGAVIPIDAPHADRLLQAAQDKNLTYKTFGESEAADYRLLSATVGAESTDVFALIDGQEIAYSIGAAGHHWAMNSLAVLAAAQALSTHPQALSLVAQALAAMQPPKGRGQRHSVMLAGQPHPVTVIDEAYNANPVSLGAALQALAALPRTGNTAGRRIVAIGDMLELGADAPAQHAAMAQAVQAAQVDMVFTAGPLSEHLYNALPSALRGGHAADSATLAPMVANTVRGGDVVMAKGSAGSRMGRIIEALLALQSSESIPEGGAPTPQE